MRNKIIAGNWKLNPQTLTEALSLAGAVFEFIKTNSPKLNASSRVKPIICPPALFASAIVDLISKSNIAEAIAVGGQNCYSEAKGAFTGENSAVALKSFGASYVVLGHSERRTLFSEGNNDVAKKAMLALQAGLVPIVCVGETAQERESKQTDSVITTQLKGSLSGFAPKTSADLIVAYEPVWAIGTGQTCSADEANRVCALIRAELASLYSASFAQEVHILYGGSVKSSTIEEQLAQTDIDGALIGGASLDATEFNLIIEKALGV